MATIPTAPLTGITPPSRRGFSQRILGEVVSDLGFCSIEAVEAVAEIAKTERRPIGQVLLEQGAISSEQLSRAIAERFGLDHVDLPRFAVDPAACALISLSAARRYVAMPIGFDGDGALLVAISEPSNVLALDDIALATGHHVRPVIAAPDDLGVLLTRLGEIDDPVAAAMEALPDEATLDEGLGPEAPDAVADLGSGADAAPVVRLVHSVLHQAIERGASDIHLAPRETGDIALHLRIDGVLVPTGTVPRRMVAGVVSRIKIMAGLDIADRHAPQDGRVSVTVHGRPVDLRVVTLPLVGGESVVLRVLDRGGGLAALEDLGLAGAQRRRVERAVARSHGAVFVTGPTGSGKTTTLYSVLGLIDRRERSVLAIEDPVEMRLDGIRQMQVNAKRGVTFATGLRSMLRADPDVVMVGEVRDRETAQIAVEAALTGHLVLSTLHTNDAPSAMSRLVEMGVEPYLVASAVRSIVAQRLVRRLCSECRREAAFTTETLQENGFGSTGSVAAWEPVGCTRCAGTGYRGRLGLYEVLDATDEIRELVVRRRPAGEIAAVAEAEGMTRMRDAGLDAVRDGVTSLAELLRVLGTA